MEQLGCLWTDFHEIWYLCIVKKNLSRKFRCHHNKKKKKCTWYEDQCTFMTISRTILLRMKNVSDRSCRENQNTRFSLSNLFFLSENRAVYKIMWKNAVESCMPQMKIRRMRFACRITKARIRNMFIIFNMYCFSTTTVVTGTRLNVTLYVFWLPC